MFKVFLTVAMLVGSLTVAFTDHQTAPAAEPGWSPVVIPTGEYRAKIKSLPIEQRPYRPLHFYGNSVRRSYYRGNPLATPRDVLTTTSKLMGSR